MVTVAERGLARSSTSGRRAGVAVWSASLLFVALYGTFMVWQYARFQVFAFDFAIFDQGLWLLSRFQDPDSTVRGLPLFADHSSYVLILLTPLYWVWPAQEALIVTTVALLAAGAPLTYLLARALGAAPGPAAAVGIAYLVHPAVAWNARDGFHPEVFVLPLVILAVLLIARQRPWWALAPLAVALAAKEDVALLLVPLGLFIAIVWHRRVFGFVVAAVSLAVFAVHFTFLLPAFSPTGSLLYSGRYDRYGEGIVNIGYGVLTRPDQLLHDIATVESVGYVAVLVLALPLALLGPRMLLVGAPALLANLLSDHPYQRSIKFHYTVYLLTVIAMAAAVGASRLTGRRPVRMAAVVVTLGAALALHGVAGPNPLATPVTDVGLDHEVIRRGLVLVPEDAVISAWDTFVPHLSHRTTVYQFPNPWERHNYGPQQASLPDPGSVEWVAVRTDIYPHLQPLVAALRASPEFEVVYDVSPVTVLRRSDPAPYDPGG